MALPGLGEMGASAMAGASKLYIYVLIFVLMAVIGGAAFLVYTLMSYKHKFRVRDIGDKHKVVFDDRAKEIRDKSGITYWKLLKLKRKVSAPPSAAIEIDTKGRKVVEAYRNEEGELTWIHDNAKILPIPKDILEIKDYATRKEKLKAWQKTNNIVASFEAYSQEERSFNIDQHDKAMAKKGQSWQEMLLSLAPFGALIIFAAILVFGFGTLTKPSIEMGQQLSATIDKVADLENIELQKLQTMREIQNDIQIIQSEMGIDTASRVPPN